MLNSVENTTVDLVKLALDAASLRQQALANNIANLNTPGYSPLRVDFESQLAGARAHYFAGNRVSDADLAAVKPSVEADEAGEGSPVSLDLEIAKVSQNVVHYQALLRGLNKRMAILGMAINEGKR